MGETEASGRTPLVCLMTYVLGKAGGPSSGLYSKPSAYEVATMTTSPSGTTTTCTRVAALGAWSEPCPGLASGHADSLTEAGCAHGADVLMGAERQRTRPFSGHSRMRIRALAGEGLTLCLWLNPCDSH